ncbi:MAG: PilZ domain-containing protein [Deltaproteobacteria bacterium]|nr:PilZ domain-containing protein [Deltaproteobacteria bacterium]MBN2670535.1 PilZ domain-containing protein [Deltaproteobacteria bacterium]
MTESNILEEQLAIGRELLISSAAPGDHLQVNASITSLGGHHFKVKAAVPVPPQLFTPQQPLKIRLKGGSRSTLPLNCRFLRIDPKKPREMVLTIPEGEWITNRRAFVRAEIKMPILVLRHSGQKLTGETIDISGGGTLVKLPSPLPPGEAVEITLGPSEETAGEALTFEAKVARLVEIRGNRKNGGEPFTATAFKFIQAPTRAQNKVCKMVIVNQFEQRRQELREFLGKE